MRLSFLIPYRFTPGSSPAHFVQEKLSPLLILDCFVVFRRGASVGAKFVDARALSGVEHQCADSIHHGILRLS